MADNATHPHETEMFFDGGCPLCLREIGMLKRWDQRQRIRFTDINAPWFQRADVGLTREALMAQMHGRLPGGNWLTGVEAVRGVHPAVGSGVWSGRYMAETCSATVAKVCDCSAEKL